MQRVIFSMIYGVAILATACKQRPQPVKPLRDNPQTAAFRTHLQALDAAKKMTVDQVRELEATVAKNPQDFDARQKLLLFYTQSGVKVVGERATIAARRIHILWFIEHQASREVERAQIPVDPGNPLADPTGYEAGKKLWLAQAGKPDATVPVLIHAAWFLEASDGELAEKLVLRAQAIEPSPANRSWLARIYAQALRGPRAGDVREKLAASNDAHLLAVVGFNLCFAYGDSEPDALGRSYLERALQADPQSRVAHQGLWMLQYVKKRYAPPNLRVLPPEAQYKAISAMPEPEKFVQLGGLAADAYIVGDMDDYYRHDKKAAKEHWDQSLRYAQEALRLAPQNRQSGDYGAVVYKANMVLGLMSLRIGNQKSAVRYMLAASKAPRCEELAYGRTFSDYNLPGQLLKYGERESVIQFLEQLAKIRDVQKDQLLASAAQIRNGEKPSWYPNP